MDAKFVNDLLREFDPLMKERNDEVDNLTNHLNEIRMLHHSSIANAVTLEIQNSPGSPDENDTWEQPCLDLFTLSPPTESSPFNPEEPTPSPVAFTPSVPASPTRSPLPQATSSRLPSVVASPMPSSSIEIEFFEQTVELPVPAVVSADNYTVENTLSVCHHVQQQPVKNITFLSNEMTSSGNFLNLDLDSSFTDLPRQDSQSANTSGCCYIDTHCHLDLLYSKLGYQGDFASFKQRFSKTWSPLYAGCVANFAHPKQFMENPLQYTDFLKNEDVRVAFGCHPKVADQYTSQVEEVLLLRLSEANVIAVGEIGLDKSQHNKVSVEQQEFVFTRMLKIGVKTFDKPLIIHCRDAEERCLELMKLYVPPGHPIHLHCYLGSYENALLWAGYFPNLYFGVTTSVCSARQQQIDFVTKIPMERLLIETDSPYFLPQQVSTAEDSLPYNHPGMGEYVAKQLANFRKVALKEVYEQIFMNTLKLYKFYG